MKYTTYIGGLVAVLLMWVLPQRLCAQGSTPELTEPLQVTTDAERAEAFFLEGQCQQMAGHYSEAYDLFSHTLQLAPDHVGALYELSNYARHLQNDSLSLALLERAAQLDSENFWLKQALVNLYVGQHRTDDAVRQLEQMTKQYPQRSDLLMMLADMYHQSEDYAGIVRTLDRIEVLEGKSEELSMQKFRTYVRMKDEQRAFAEVQALADEYPNDLRYQVLVGDLYCDQGQYDKAWEVYDKIRQQSPDNINLQLALANYYEKTGADSLAEATLEHAIVNPELDTDTRLRLMQFIAYDNIQQKGDTAQVMNLFRQLLARPQQDTRMPELAARYMVTRELPADDVKPVLHQLLSLDPEFEMARNQLLSYAISEDDTTAIVHLCKTAVDYGSSDPVYYYYLGIGYFQQNKSRAAIDAVKKGLQKTDDKSNLLLVTNMYAILGDLYHRIGDDTKAFESYDSCLIYRPDDALVLNNYAYYLSLKKQDLQRAEEMSRRSLEKEGDNPTYLDTYAWILFQQRKYEEAREYIDRVISLLGDKVDPEDVSLIEHAGDIYSKCGNTERAVEFWKQAQQLGGGSALLEKKINKRKYYEK